ncbi:MAG TPA: hypothetical protein VFX30_12350 [bacterium]|nr:hypothetical protein [bacterium]
MISPTLPAGYSLIPAGLSKGVEIASFGFKQTPVTNQEYGDMGRNQFVLLDHNWATGETRLKRRGQDIEEVVGGPTFVTENFNFDKGDILTLGSIILLKMAEDPSPPPNEYGRIFSGANKPAVGVTYFHAKTWCLLKTLENGGEFVYDLPTEAQYLHQFVVSDRRTKKYGTETTEYITLWIKIAGNHFDNPWSLSSRAMSDSPDPHFHYCPGYRNKYLGFSPLAVRQDSPA